MSVLAAEPAILAPIVTASAILIAGVIDDFRTRKVHNRLFLACSAIALVVVAAAGGIAAVPTAIFGFLAGLAIFLPLVLIKAIGAGDMKLLAAFGIAAGPSAVVS